MCGPAGFGSALRFIATKMSARDTTRSVPRKSHLDFTPACSYSRSMEVNRSGTDGTTAPTVISQAMQPKHSWDRAKTWS